MNNHQCLVHDPDDVIPGRICGRPLPCKEHGPRPFCAARVVEGRRDVVRLPDHPWVDRELTMRAIRRLADSLEEIAREADGADSQDRERLEKVFQGRLVAIDSLVRGCP